MMMIKNEQVSETAEVIMNRYTCIILLCCSKIPIAITRVREGAVSGGAVGKLELTRRNNSKGNDKQLKRKAGRKEALTSRSSRTIKKVPNFKKLHKQFEAHVACVSDKWSRDS